MTKLEKAIANATNFQEALKNAGIFTQTKSENNTLCIEYVCKSNKQANELKDYCVWTEKMSNIKSQYVVDGNRVKKFRA